MHHDVHLSPPGWDFELMKEHLRRLGSTTSKSLEKEKVVGKNFRALKGTVKWIPPIASIPFSIEAVKSNKEIARQRELASSIKHILSQRM
jgi:hypothetical protein